MSKMLKAAGSAAPVRSGAAPVGEGEAPAEPRCFPKRKRPAAGLFVIPNRPTLVFLTVCTKGRGPWLATPSGHAFLREIWNDGQAWLVGRYVLMPDHLHLFCAPNASGISLDRWVRYWKSRFTKYHSMAGHRWQAGHWDRRLRREESYAEKWAYVRANPVRAGLVKSADAWPFQGEMVKLPW